jgi:hypothetical protein
MSSEQLFAALSKSLNKDLIDLIRVEIREGLKQSVREELKIELKKEEKVLPGPSSKNGETDTHCMMRLIILASCCIIASLYRP